MGERAGMVAFVTTARMRERDLAAEALTLSADLSRLACVLAFGAAPEGAVRLAGVQDAGSLPVDGDYASYVAGLARGPNDTVTLAWTSGTEGVPKGVPRSYGDWEVVGHATSQCPRLMPEDRLLNLFPMVNAGGLGGMFLPWLLLGCTLTQHHPFSLRCSWTRSSGSGSPTPARRRSSWTRSSGTRR